MASGDLKVRVSVVESDHLDRLTQQLDRVEFKLDQILQALADADDSDEDATPPTLDGDRMGRGRQQDEPL